MKVTRNTPDQLIIENNPIFVVLLMVAASSSFIVTGLFYGGGDRVMGTASVVVGLVLTVGVILVFARRRMFIFDRPSNLIEMRQRTVFGYSKRAWELHHLDHAEMQSKRSQRTTNYRAALVFLDGMDAGTYPVTVVYEDRYSAKVAIEAINNWHRAPLDSQGPTT